MNPQRGVVVSGASTGIGHATALLLARSGYVAFAGVRNEADVPTIAVGAITEADHVNSIIASGRADLCALSRPHLADPAWVLRESAKLGYRRVEWPRQYLFAKEQMERAFQRAPS